MKILKTQKTFYKPPAVRFDISRHKKFILVGVALLIVLLLLVKAWPNIAAKAGASSGATVPAGPPKVYNQLLQNQTFEFKEFPFAIKQKLDAPARYNIWFETDKPIQFIVYSEQRYNEWLSTKSHTISKVNTQTGGKCCAATGSYNIDINQGEAGTYYLVFDGSAIKEKALLPSSGKIIITKLSGI